MADPEPPSGRVRELLALVVGGLSAAGVHYEVFRYFDRRDLSWCGDGLDGLGCAIFSVFIVAVLAVVSGALLNWAVLRAAKVRYAGPVAFLSTFAFAAWWLFIDSLIEGTNWAVVPILVPPVVLNLLTAGLFRIVTPKRSSVALMTGLVFLAAFPLVNQGNDLEIRRSRDEQNDNIENADFDVFVPSWLPVGYELGEVHFRQFGDDPAFGEVTAVYGDNDAGDPSPFTVTSFHVPASFNPPENCGADKPYEGVVRACTSAGTTGSGETMYVDNGASFSNRQTFYVRRGATVITLEASAYKEDMPPTTAIWIFDGMRPYEP